MIRALFFPLILVLLRVKCQFWFCSQQAANESTMEEDLGLIGASAEDTEAELIRKICETELLAGNKSLSFLLPCHASSCLNGQCSCYICQDLTDVFLILHFVCLVLCFSWTDFRGEPVVCFSSPAGESVQLPRTLLPPTARHCSLPGSLSVHDDKVNMVATNLNSFSVSYGTRLHCLFFFFFFFLTVLLKSSLRGKSSMILWELSRHCRDVHN